MRKQRRYLQTLQLYIYLPCLTVNNKINVFSYVVVQRAITTIEDIEDILGQSITKFRVIVFVFIKESETWLVYNNNNNKKVGDVVLYIERQTFQP